MAFDIGQKLAFSISVIKKEHHLVQHQSWRNSGVLNPGFNYETCYLKTRVVVDGTRRTQESCRANEISLSMNSVSRPSPPTTRRRDDYFRPRCVRRKIGVETQILQNRTRFTSTSPSRSPDRPNLLSGGRLRRLSEARDLSRRQPREPRDRLLHRIRGKQTSGVPGRHRHWDLKEVADVVSADAVLAHIGIESSGCTMQDPIDICLPGCPHRFGPVGVDDWQCR